VGAGDAVEAIGRRADELAPESERLRRLPDELVGPLVDSGLLRTWVPRRYGGAQASVLEGLDLIERLAYHDGATSWCAMIALTTSLTAAFLPPAVAEEIYGDPAVVTGGYALPAGRARAVEGGLVVDGRWSWGSGTAHCTWIGGGCLVVDDSGGPAPRPDGLVAPFVFFPRAEVELLDTWRVMGLRGTGSTDYAVHDAFVPEGRWIQLGGTPLEEAPLYRLPFLSTLALGVCTVALGLARRAGDELAGLAGSKRPAQSNRTLAERPAVQADVAQAEAAWRSARAFVVEAVSSAEAEAEAASGGPLGDDHVHRLRLAATDAVWRSAAAVDACYSAGGGSSIHEDSPLQRVFRDVHVVTQHGMVAERTYEPLGRRSLGLPTDMSRM
jgi:alkylation response protein AidB-like acyl-CoA dehydrogenase